MEESYILPDNSTGLELAWKNTVALRKCGFKTSLQQYEIKGFSVLRLIAYKSVPSRAVRVPESFRKRGHQR